MGEAAKHAGISKATLSRAIKSGRVSAHRNDKGGFDIDPAELFRVYPRNAATVVSNSSMKQDATPSETPETAGETLALKAEIDGLKAQLALMREHSDDIKSQRDSWQKQAESAQRLLADQRPHKRGWFGLGKVS
ncbi:MAG: DNA-binding protein [Microcystis wesenbergii Mw_MB_S_20031200_S109D]|uniref:DNA-binding protein n=1 Tax=Microcystis wesenbergii Mw_MB_S_20031200_S109D TaxID=2486241 RepID=A0A552M147_9CHRO|nr:MAG: DNA-binding protein [Microcystis wesenbergii Mw_MB_S_20031200_S109D]